MLVGNFEKRYEGPVSGAWLGIFSPLIGTNSETTEYILSYAFWLNTSKGNAKARAVNLLRLYTLRENKTAF